jgi:copper chaperone CopZ
MSCNNCRAHVEEALKKVDGVTRVSVDLQKAEAVISMESHIPLEKFQEALKNEGGNYSISITRRYCICK